jgi:probable H4MPT-linked C1 transfer pathway protein
MTWLGLDIGGANIKAASTDGFVSNMPFRFWVEHDKLEATLTEIIKSCDSPSPNLAVTMTAELADCFKSRKIGVEQIVDCVVNVCSSLELSAPIFAGTDVTFRNASDAKQQWLKTAAANWAMTASYASRFLTDSTGLVVDMGSTTTDIIPVENGMVKTRGKTDSQRLRTGELVYVGAGRTPVCSVISRLVLEGNDIPIAREFFATVGDAMLVSGMRDEAPEDFDTADGRSMTTANAARRICRMVCEDFDDVGMREAKLLSCQILKQVEHIISEAIEYRSFDPDEIVVTGSGCDFVRTLFSTLFPRAYIKPLALMAGNEVNDVAPALAVAVLASEAA